MPSTPPSSHSTIPLPVDWEKFRDLPLKETQEAHAKMVKFNKDNSDHHEGEILERMLKMSVGMKEEDVKEKAAVDKQARRTFLGRYSTLVHSRYS
ncbi:MAG: hypothetical protein V4534_06405 [Myxococcota bacterium]